MKTTINIKTQILEKITKAAQSRGISRSEMITTLIKKVIEDIVTHAPLGRPIRYQKKASHDQWHKFHLRLKHEEYEYFMDLRKVMKMSVSLILALAVKKYLKALSKKNIGDNYRFQNYILSMVMVGGAIIWTLIWGNPRKIE